MQELSSINSEKLYSSIFLVKQINLFRKSEGNNKELLHFTLLAKIEKRFGSKIEDKKILLSSYLGKNSKQEKCYQLPFEYCLRILMDESETVQDKCVEIMKAQHAKINKLEEQVKEPQELPSNFLEALKLLVAKEEQTQELQAQKQKLEVEVKTLENKTEYTEKVLTVTDTLLATEVCKEFGFKSANAMNKKLVEEGIIYKVRDHFVMTAKYAGKGYEKYSDYCYNSKVNGTPKISRQMEWTQLGRAFLHKLFNKDLSYSKSYTYATIQISATA